MNGAEFIAQVLSTGSVAGAKVGDGIERIDSVIPLSYVEDTTGRGESKTLRRDYGIFEVACSGDHWTCRAISIEVHRLHHFPDLRDEMREKLGVTFDPFTRWKDVQQEYERIAENRTLEMRDEAPEYQVFRDRSTGVSVRLVADKEAKRGNYPGSGDVWSLDLVSPSFM